jgi:hypothetical protein
MLGTSRQPTFHPHEPAGLQPPAVPAEHNDETVLNGLDHCPRNRLTKKSGLPHRRFRALVRRLPHCVPYLYQSDQSAFFSRLRSQDTLEKWAFISPEIRFVPTAKMTPCQAAY